MQAVKLDFSRIHRTPRWVAPLLFSLAAAFAFDVGFSLAGAMRSVWKSEKAMAQLQPHAYQAPRPVAKEEVSAARETMQRLATPWDKLFDALEAAASDQVTLLSIEPDPKAGTVTISGDGKDYLAALSYVLNLSRADALSHVQLARHEVKENDPHKAVAFTVSAAWSPH